MASQLDIQPQYSLRALNTFGIDAKAAHFLKVTDAAQLHALYREPSLARACRD
jgi:UDP-N-acetylmuramate dehydrogenase